MLRSILDVLHVSYSLILNFMMIINHTRKDIARVQLKRDEFRVFHHQASYNRHLYICKVIYRLILRKHQVLGPSLVHCNMGSHHSPSDLSMGTVDNKPQTPWHRSKHNCQHSMDGHVCILFQVDLLC